MKARPIRAWAIKRNNKLNANEVFTESDVVLDKGEKLVRIELREI